MSRSNIKGALERARQRWHFGAIYICRRMGRGATGALQTAGLLVEHTSRALFHRHGHLVAFPGLDLLALLAGVNEKTIRRSIDRLEEAGLVWTQQRHNDSNLYYLTIPPDAETHLFACEAAIIKRRKARQHRDHKRPSPPEFHLTDGDTKCPTDRTDGNGADTKCPTTSDFTSDLHSIPKGRDLASRRLSEDQKDKRVGEEVRSPAGPQHTPMAECFRDARKIGAYADSVVGRAANHWYRRLRKSATQLMPYARMAATPQTWRRSCGTRQRSECDGRLGDRT